jgi:hypothetical protein
LKLTEEVAHSLVNLRASGDFQRFMKWIAENALREVQICVEQEGPILFRAQGAAQVLQRLMEVQEEAPRLVEKLKYQR